MAVDPAPHGNPRVATRQVMREGRRHGRPRTMIKRGTTQEPRPEPGRRERKTGKQGITEGKKRKT